MHGTFPRFLFVVLAALCLVPGWAPKPGWAQSTPTGARYSTVPMSPYPPNIGQGAGGPMVMLAASRDHTLFSPIYTDFEDVDGDGADDATFLPTFTYYGYFDPIKCYAYNPSYAKVGRFEPEGLAGTATVVLKGKSTVIRSCAQRAGRWSGNFLNWATMTRIDVVRKMLYGGRRLEDPVGAGTTLEMAQMSHDAHSFVKYYSGADINHHTPFDLASDLGGAGLTLCNRGSRSTDPDAADAGHPQLRLAKGNASLWGTTPASVCNWENERPYAFGVKTREFYKKYGPAQATAAMAHLERVPKREVINGVEPELAVRVLVCKEGLLGSERCRTYVDASQRATIKPIGLLQEFATTPNPDQAGLAEFGLITGSYDSNLRGGLLRKNIGAVNDEVDPGTGRFCHNMATVGLPANCVVSDGIVQTFDRLRLYSTGNYNGATIGGKAGAPNRDFLRPQDLLNGDHASWGNPMSELIVQALAYFAGSSDLGMSSTNDLRGLGRDRAIGLAQVASADPLDDVNSVDRASKRKRASLYGRGICRPMHVLAISSGSVSYDGDESGESEDVHALAPLFIATNGGKGTLASATDRIGELEGINASLRSVGSVSNGFGSDCTAKLIGSGQGIGTAYSAGLSAVSGVCPEAPAVKGSYLGAGAAFSANTRAVRDVDSGDVLSSFAQLLGGNMPKARLPVHALRVKTFAASLSGGVPRIEVPVGDTGRKVYITPESAWRHGNYKDSDEPMPGALLTFKAIALNRDAERKTASGAYVVSWNDAQFGGDYDMDIIGFLRWEVRPAADGSAGHELFVMTDLLGSESGARGSHGFSVVGSSLKSGYDQDGRYLTHATIGAGNAGYLPESSCTRSSLPDLLCAFSDQGMSKGPSQGWDGFTWPSQHAGQDVDFTELDGPRAGKLSSTTVRKFYLAESESKDKGVLREPLWYAAKYGSFDTGEKAGAFAVTSAALPSGNNWDKLDNASAQPCASGSCPDGEPDGYFLARRPDLLEQRLRTLLTNLTANSNAAPATSSTQLLAGALRYQASFNRNEFSGDVQAYPLLIDGTFGPSVWSAGKALADAPPDSRKVITDQPGVSGGIEFSVDGLAAEAQAPYVRALLGLPDGSTLSSANRDELRRLVDYMRGSTSDQASGSPTLRLRPNAAVTRLGPVVNSSPWVQDNASGARFSDSDFGPGSPAGLASASGTGAAATPPSYRAHVLAKASRPSVLWVGANDGMLHAFEAKPIARDAQGQSVGPQPLLSYVPSPLVSRLASALSIGNTSDVPLVDGSPYSADVLVSSAQGQAWRTYLFGSLGRGGRAIFALDTTELSTSTTQAGAKNMFKWMFSSADDADLGHALTLPTRHRTSGQPNQVVYLNNGRFALLHPNGHGASTGRAVLYVLDVAGPGSAAWSEGNGILRKIATRASDNANGLMGITWVDLDNNATADIAYGTDLKGQLWRFDLRSADPANWGVALINASTQEGLPLFQATDSSGRPLPITTPPVVNLPSFGGMMVSFGTGRAIEAGDFPEIGRTQRFFTVWDRGRYEGDITFPPLADPAVQGATATPRALPSLSRTVTLTQADGSTASRPTFIQRVLRRDAAGNVFMIRASDSGVPVLGADGKEQALPMNLATRFDPALHEGWFFDFPDQGNDGEALISSPLARASFMLFTTSRRQLSNTQSLTCSEAPLSALYALSPVNGLPVPGLLIQGAEYVGMPVPDQLVEALLDRANDEVVPDASTDPKCDPKTQKCCDPSKQKCACDPNKERCCATGQVAVRVVGASTDERICAPANNLRIQWREITGLRTR